MLSQTAEYALRAVVCLAEGAEIPTTTEEIAARTRVPAAYLAKVLGALARAGLVRSQRGLGGGFVLERPAEAISLLEVVDAVEPVRRIERCPLGLPSHDGALCPLHRRLDDAIASVETILGGSTIADVLEEPGANVPLCPSRVTASSDPGRPRGAHSATP